MYEFIKSETSRSTSQLRLSSEFDEEEGPHYNAQVLRSFNTTTQTVMD